MDRVIAAVYLGRVAMNSPAFLLSPLALLIVCAYSFFKRFSALAHFVLGLALGIAPVGAWIAVTGNGRRNHLC